MKRKPPLILGILFGFLFLVFIVLGFGDPIFEKLGVEPVCV